jgi:hypothetical protein
MCGLDYILISIKSEGDFIKLAALRHSYKAGVAFINAERWLEKMLFLKSLRGSL